jgi:hypothetical protein
MAEIVLVHGIGQEHGKADELENVWLEALSRGVAAAGFPKFSARIWGKARKSRDIRDIEARMAFYGHLFLVPGQQGAGAAPLNGQATVLAEQLGEEWLKRVATRATNAQDRTTAERELMTLQGKVGVAQGPGGAVRVVLKGLAKIHWFAPYGIAFAETFINRSLTQVTGYLTDKSIREAAKGIVRSLIGPETKVVIGHSLGSVVAYEALQDLQEQLQQPLPLFITLGSPLGFDTIIYSHLHPQPPCFPLNLRRWVNIAARDDFIAVEPNLTNLFKEGMPLDAVFEGGYTVDNGAQPHRADFYLSKIEVGRPIGNVFASA